MPTALWTNFRGYERRVAVVAGALLLMAGSLAWSVMGPVLSAAADPLGDCSTTSGVIVAVDFSHWGGNYERGCDATLSTGYAALQAAGFTTAGTTEDGPAFICRIDDDPPPADDPCVTTSPASAYWSYWHANAGVNTWSLSGLGAMSYHPQPGSVDAWTFGNTHAPLFLPSAVRATNAGAPAPKTATTTTVRATTTTTTTAPASASPVAGTSTRQSVPSASVVTNTVPKTPGSASTGAASSGHPTTTTAPPGKPPAQPRATVPRAVTTSTSSADRSPATTAAGTPTHGPSTPKIVDVAPVAAAPESTKSSTGSDAGVLIGGLVVLAIGGAGAATAWQRRRRTT